MRKLLTLLKLSLSIAVYSFQLTLNADEINTDQEVDQEVALSGLSFISPNVIPPGTHLNKYHLLLQVGQDETLPQSALGLFTTSGFTDFLGWDDLKIADFREAAIAWFQERYGLDFSTGTYDPVMGTVLTDFGVMIPIRYQGYYRVLSSNNLDIPAYTILTPSSICLAQYIVAFFFPPTYSGTYANGGPDIIGNSTDTLSYGCYRIFLNYQGTKHRTIFSRSYYPNEAAPQVEPTREIDRFQLFSPEYGPGFGILNSGLDLINHQTNARGTWSFPGTFQPLLDDWNGYTEAPVAP